MKIKNVFDEIFSTENLYLAYIDASRGRRYKKDVLAFGYDVWANIEKIRQEVYSGTYDIEKYHKFYVYEPKKRMIMSIAFEHRVVQWAIYRVINPILAKGYISDSYGCIPGRGALGAMLRLKGWLSHVSKKKGRWYYLKLDISKYFYRISHDVLKRIISKRISDERLVDILSRIIDCTHTPFGLPEGAKIGDVDDSKMLYDVGMPIGNLLSQMFANLYLNELDQACKRKLGIRYYIRYMDDIIILDCNKKRLHRLYHHIEKFLEKVLRLKINSKSCIRPINNGVEFVGYRIWHNKATLRKSTTLRIKRSLRGVAKKYRERKLDLDDISIILAYYRGLLSHTNSDTLTTSLFSNYTLSRVS